MIRISLLGRFEIRLDGEAFELNSRPAQALLAYVLLHPDVPVRREKLADAKLPTGDARQSAAAYGAAAAIRDRIGSAIDPADQDRYQANLEQLRTSLGEGVFEDAWRRGAGKGPAQFEALELLSANGSNTAAASH